MLADTRLAYTTTDTNMWAPNMCTHAVSFNFRKLPGHMKRANVSPATRDHPRGSTIKHPL